MSEKTSHESVKTSYLRGLRYISWQFFQCDIHILYKSQSIGNPATVISRNRRKTVAHDILGAASFDLVPSGRRYRVLR